MTSEELYHFIKNHKHYNKPWQYFIVKDLIERGIDYLQFHSLCKEIKELLISDKNSMCNMYKDIEKGRIKD